MLKSQVENRKNKSLSQTFSIVGKDGKINKEITDLLQNQIFVNEVNSEILNTKLLKHSLGQWIYENGRLKFDLIPRQNVDPVNGLVYLDYTEDKFIKYREMKEYGVWVLEFGDTKLSADFGLVN